MHRDRNIQFDPQAPANQASSQRIKFQAFPVDSAARFPVLERFTVEFMQVENLDEILELARRQLPRRFPDRWG